MKSYFISGIGTDVGKTVVSAILCEALKADYWKPIQSGGLEHSDGNEVRRLISNPITKFHPEVYLLPEPLSPHAAAERAGIEIDTSRFTLPPVQNTLIIEGAGGLLVPITRQFLVADLILQLKVPVVLVSRHYLGSINHTLMSIEILKHRKIPIAGIVFNGDQNQATEQVIEEQSGCRILGRISPAKNLDHTFISEQAALFNQLL